MEITLQLKGSLDNMEELFHTHNVRHFNLLRESGDNSTFDVIIRVCENFSFDGITTIKSMNNALSNYSSKDKQC